MPAGMGKVVSVGDPNPICTVLALPVRYARKQPFAIRVVFVYRMIQDVLLVVLGELNVPRAGVGLQGDAHLVKGASDVVARRDLSRRPIG